MNGEIYPLNQLGIINRKEEYIGIRLTGLFGDTIHASTRFKYILNQYPDHPWIIFHSYPVRNKCFERIKIVYDNMLKHWIDNGRIKYYFYDFAGRPGAHALTIPSIMNALKFSRTYPNQYYDCAVTNARVPGMNKPNLGIDIPKRKDPYKAVILRYSGWHRHFMGRNRPYSEWYKIEQKLLDSGYEVHLVGVDDRHPNRNNLIDHRKKLNVRELLEFSKDASICICPATFLYVWMQFVCPTAVLSDKGDVHNLNTNWKLNENMKVFNVHTNNYMKMLFNFIDSVVQKREELLRREKQLEEQKINKVIIKNGKRTLLRTVAYG